MRKFDYKKLKNLTFDNEVLGYIAAIYQEKGKQEMYLKQKPLELEKLVEIAKIQSTEASNAIEGIRTTNTRIRQLVLEKTAPKNRAEEEIGGYREALKTIHESFEYIPLEPNYILQLHKIMFSLVPNSYGGKFKPVQNYISATDAEGKSFTLFTPLAPYETPEAVERICEEFNHALADGVEPLILIPTFIHDFLCIHPFLDGNGRMSRLLTTLLLYRSGFWVGKYISLEKKIADRKDEYYDALYASQQGWYKAKDDPMPFVKYILGTVLAAYRDFEDRFRVVSNGKSSTETVRLAIGTMIGKFTKQDVVAVCPSLAKSTIELALKELSSLGEIERRGTGKGTYYIRLK